MGEVSKITDGKYFRATNNKKLEEIYKVIDTLEKTRIEVTSYRKAKELFYSWLGFGLLFILAELLISKLYLKKLP